MQETKPPTPISRFIAYLPDADGAERAVHGRIKRCVEALGLHITLADRWLLAVDRQVSANSGAPPEMLLDVFPGTAASARFASADFAHAATLDAMHCLAEASAQCYNLIQAGERDFRLESDAMGLKPAYVAHVAGGTLLGSRIRDVLQLFPELLHPTDTTALYEMLGFWGPLANRTLHRKIRRTPPGCRYHWTPESGLTLDCGRAFQPAPVVGVQFVDVAEAAIHDAARKAVAEKTKGAVRPLVLSLSGGFDSRYLAALCHDLHIDVSAVTHGLRHHREYRSTRAVAQLLGLRLHASGYRRDVTLDELPAFLDAMEGTADPAALSIMNVFDPACAPGTPILHGFYGDHLAGAHLAHYRGNELTSREAVADAVIRHYFPPDRPDVRRAFQPAPDLDEVRDDVLSGLRTDCQAYQAYAMWYSDNRTRRFVASQAALLGKRYDVVMPFYDRALFGLWSSLPPIARRDRHLFRLLLARHYPALARVPHSEEATPIIPNLRWQLAGWRHQMPQQLLSAVAGPERARRLLRRLYLDDNILALNKLAAPQQRARVIMQLETLRPAMRQALGVELAANYASILDDARFTDPQALRTLFAIASYAERLIDDGASAPRAILSSPTVFQRRGA